MHVYCDWEGAPLIYSNEECHLFLFGADPYPEMIEGSGGTFYKGTQIFCVPLGLEAWWPNQNNEQENSSREVIRWGGYTPNPDTTCGGAIFNHDNVFFDELNMRTKIGYVDTSMASGDHRDLREMVR